MQWGYERGDVGGDDNLEELIRSIVTQSLDGRRGIEEADALLLTMCYDLGQTEALMGLIDKVHFVAIEDLPLDAPMIVDVVGIIEIYTPTFALRREAAQEQYLGPFGQEGTKRMPFALGGALGYVFGV